jgi:hypothetical protein
VSEEQSFIAMKVSALAVDPLTGLPMVILTDDVGGTAVPVGIGLGEASAIAAELDDIDLERPMTHQLMGDLLDAAGARVRRVELRDAGGPLGAPCAASVVLELACGKVVHREARPSDAFALALRCAAPVMVSASVLDRMLRAQAWSSSADPGETIFEDSQSNLDACASVSGPGDSAVLEQLGAEAFGKWKM